MTLSAAEIDVLRGGQPAVTPDEAAPAAPQMSGPEPRVWSAEGYAQDKLEHAVSVARLWGVDIAPFVSVADDADLGKYLIDADALAKQHEKVRELFDAAKVA